MRKGLTWIKLLLKSIAFLEEVFINFKLNYYRKLRCILIKWIGSTDPIISETEFWKKSLLKAFWISSPVKRETIWEPDLNVIGLCSCTESNKVTQKYNEIRNFDAVWQVIRRDLVIDESAIVLAVRLRACASVLVEQENWCTRSLPWNGDVIIGDE